MSIWYEIKDIDDVNMSEDGKMIQVNFAGDDNGNIWVEIPVEYIKEKLIKNYMCSSCENNPCTCED